MLTLLRDMIAHKGHATAAVLAAVGGSEAASADGELVELLHHILIANRFWICAVRRVPFNTAHEMSLPRALGPLAKAFQATQSEEDTWLTAAAEGDCAATLTDPLIPGGQCAVGDALTQVCMHSHAHRAQIATLLRRHGVVPPQTDFIFWLAERPRPTWTHVIDTEDAADHHVESMSSDDLPVALTGVKYLCLAYGAEQDWLALSKQEQDDLLAQDEVLRSRGSLVAAVAPSVTTVRAWDGTPALSNEPFAQLRAPLAGFGVIEAADLAEAIALVANTPCARAGGAVELRPIAAINHHASVVR